MNVRLEAGLDQGYLRGSRVQSAVCTLSVTQPPDPCMASPQCFVWDSAQLKIVLTPNYASSRPLPDVPVTLPALIISLLRSFTFMH
jgi:hypothetical protein